MNQALKDLGDGIAAALAEHVTAVDILRGELVLRVHTASLPRVMTYLRDDAQCLFKQLMDLCGVDYPERAQRFEVVYNLLSLKHNQRVRVKVTVGEDEPVPSVVGIFPCAAWYERECWDMYGVPFAENPDLRRLLTDYGFDGHPLRKDFPLTGFVEVRYSEDEKRVVYEPVKLTQDFRSFDFLSPWEGMLPGDEKATK
jgi:NADH-quinone oxidoreductase subunit C